MPKHPLSPMRCWVYKGTRQEEMYLYLARRDGFADLPEPLRRAFGTPSLVLELTLSPARPLAREEVTAVMKDLHTRGYHLQMPPQTRARLRLGD